MSHDGVGLRAVDAARSRFLTAGVLALPVLAGCSSDEDEARQAARRPRTSRPPPATWSPTAAPCAGPWTRCPSTLNTFQADADAATTRIAGAVLPVALHRSTRSGQPAAQPRLPGVREGHRARAQAGRPLQAQPAGGVERRPGDRRRRLRRPVARAERQGLRVLDRPQRRLRPDREDRARRQTTWRSRSPSPSRTPTGGPCSPRCTRRRSRAPRTPSTTAPARTLKVTAGPFQLKSVDRKARHRHPRPQPALVGQPAKLDRLVLTRRAARGAGRGAGRRQARPRRDRPAAARPDRRSRPATRPRERPGRSPTARAPTSTPADRARVLGAGARLRRGRPRRPHGQPARRPREAVEEYAAEQTALRGFVVRKSLEPAYTQLALNGESGPLADERVRRAVARALDRKELAETVLKPLGLPAEPLGSHLALAGQRGVRGQQRRLGDQDTKEAQALLADAGLDAGRRASRSPTGTKAGSEGGGAEGGRPRPSDGQGGRTAPTRPTKAAKATTSKPPARPTSRRRTRTPSTATPQRRRARQRPPRPSSAGAVHRPADGLQGTAVRAEASTADDAAAATGTGQRQQPAGRRARRLRPARHRRARPAPRRRPLGKDGKPLTLRFVLPSGPGSESLRTVGEQIARMLDRDRHPHRDHQGRRRQLLQGPHRLGRLRPGAVLLARHRLPGHRRPADLRQAGARRRRLAAGRAELHPRRHRPDRPALRPGGRRARRGRGPRPDAQGRRPDLGRGRIHPALPAPAAGGRQHEAGQRRRLRLRSTPLPGHRLQEAASGRFRRESKK